jgi:hypothetical protein
VVTDTSRTTDGRAVTIDWQFRGPPESGNGGYSCGVAATALGTAPAVVRLRVPPPLGRALVIERGEGSTRLLDGATVVAEAQPADDVDIEPPRPVPFHDAVAAREHMDVDAYAADHPFPSCFTCGPGREAGDGLQIFPSEVDGRDGLVVSPWVPDASFGLLDGGVRDEILWAALDCPSGLAWMFGDPSVGPAVLGELAVAIVRRPSVGQELVVAGWRVGADGRKRHAGSAVWSADGDLLAKARATWIVLAGEQRASFNATTR